MCKIFFTFLVFAFAQVASAQYAGYKPVANMSAFKTQFADASQKINTIASDFTQQKTLSMLSDKITSKGKFYFKKSNTVRMEYTSPYQYLMVIKDNKVLIKNGQKTNTMSARSNKMFRQMNQLMVDCARGTVFDNKDFSVKLFEGAGAYLAEMTPLTKEMSTLFKKVTLTFNKAGFAVNQIQLTEPGGDNTVITYHNQKFNIPLSDALFDVR
ncbi:MAG: outer membrane lipoprotein carrier protein LolA [Niabella sp.]